MLARRSFIAACLNAAVVGALAAPAMTVAQSDAAATSPASTGSPRTRGRAPGNAQSAAAATSPASTASPRTRGRARGKGAVTADAGEPSAIRSSGSPASRGRRRLGITEETVAGAASLR